MLAVPAGILRDQATPLTDRPYVLWFFVILFLLLRIKIFMDDQTYFANPETANPHFRLGLLFGIVSWLAWAGGAWAVNNQPDAYFLCGVALGISTVWIVTVAIRKGATTGQYYWLASNAILMMFFWLAARALQGKDEFTAALLLFGGIIVTSLDFAVSKSTLEL